jgi:hypothetical protein
MFLGEEYEGTLDMGENPDSCQGPRLQITDRNMAIQGQKAARTVLKQYGMAS